MAAKLAVQQNKALQIIMGAYKATRVRQLETEAYIPPIDIWLEAKSACFHRQLDRTGMAKLILSLSAPIRRQVLQRQQNRHRRQPTCISTPIEQGREDALKWFQARDFASCSGEPQTRILRNWKTRWRGSAGQRTAADQVWTSPKQVRQDTEPTAAILAQHKDLRKAESSVLVQARTGCTGLAQFLYRCKVPGFTTPDCSCGTNAPETTRHLVQYCPLYSGRETLHPSTARHRGIDYRWLTGTAGGAKALTRWIIGTGRLPQYSLAKRFPF